VRLAVLLSQHDGQDTGGLGIGGIFGTVFGILVGAVDFPVERLNFDLERSEAVLAVRVVVFRARGLSSG
jgi:hypothetical protein